MVFIFLERSLSNDAKEGKKELFLGPLGLFFMLTNTPTADMGTD